MSYMRKIIRERILKKSNYKCVYCGETEKLEIDHIIPVSRGGREDEDNMQALCEKCNRKKGAGIEIDKYFIKGNQNFIFIKKDFPFYAFSDAELKHIFKTKIIQLCQQ